MAQNLQAKIPENDTLLLNDRNEDALQKFKEEAKGKGKSVEVVSTAREVAERSEVIITVLPGPRHVKSVFGNILHPRLPSLHPSSAATDRLFIDCSTIDPTSSTEIANAVHSSSSGRFVDAPMSGGVVGARASTLTFMLGCPSHNGNGKLAERVTPILHLMGSKVVHLGESGMGLAGKLANNYLLAVSNIATAEAMHLGNKLGLDPVKLAGLINESSGACWSSKVNSPIEGVSPGAPAEKGFEGGFAVDLMTKDLGLAVKAAEDSGADLELARRAEEVYKNVEEEEMGRDFSVVYRWLEGRGQKRAVV
ncbi:MAG: hypothetical protein Q9222_000978 [Ikaeria aurantiellina]